MKLLNNVVTVVFFALFFLATSTLVHADTRLQPTSYEPLPCSTDCTTLRIYYNQAPPSGSGWGLANWGGLQWSGSAGPTNIHDNYADYTWAYPYNQGTSQVVLGAGDTVSSPFTIDFSTDHSITIPSADSVEMVSYELIVPADQCGSTYCATVRIHYSKAPPEGGWGLTNWYNGTMWSGAAGPTNIHDTYADYTFGTPYIPSGESRYVIASADDFSSPFTIDWTGYPTPTPTPVLEYNVSGNVYVDENQNGVKDSNEVNLPNVQAKLVGPSERTTQTDSEGNYSFTQVPAGYYRAVITVPNGYLPSTPGHTYFTLSADTTANFGLASATVSTLFSDDFTDANNTPIHDHNTLWRVLDGSPIIVDNSLNSSDNSIFKAITPEISTTNTCQSVDVQFPMTSEFLIMSLRWNEQQGTGYNFFINAADQSIQISTFSPYGGDYIGNATFVDSNLTGTHIVKFCAIGERLEVFIDNQSVRYANHGTYQSGISSLYYKSGPVDNYRLESVDAPVPSDTPTPTPTDTPSPTPTQIPTYTISGSVYVDANENGFQDSGENGYEGADVDLTGDGSQTVQTNATGDYSLANLTAGNYTVALTVPNGYVATTNNPVSIPLTTNTTVHFGIKQSSQPIGYPTPGDTEDSSNRNVMNGTKFTVGPVGGTVESISAYVGDIDASPNNEYQMAIYTSKANGRPGTKIAETAVGTLTANSWNTLPITASFSPLTSYWLMYNTNASSDDVNNLYITTSEPNIGAYYAQNFGTWPAGFPDNPTMTNQLFSIYVNMIPDGPLPTVLVGNDTLEAYQDSNGAGSAEAFKYTALTSGTANTIALYLNNDNAATRVRVGIYTDNNGNPGTLLSQAEITNTVEGSWNVLTLPTTTITQGTNYWIAVLSPRNRGIVRFRDKASGGTSVGSQQTNLTTLPNTWTTGPTWTTTDLSAYLY